MLLIVAGAVFFPTSITNQQEQSKVQVCILVEIEEKQGHRSFRSDIKKTNQSVRANNRPGFPQ